MISEVLGKKPEIGKNVFVHASAVVTGDVALGDGVNIWPCAVLRGDISRINIGDGSNVQDNCVLHTGHGQPLEIGRNVVIGHNVCLHSCTIEEDTLIGIGAIVLDGVKVGRGSWVAAGSVLPPGKEYPAEMMIMGSPAKAVRPLTQEEMAHQRFIVSWCQKEARDYQNTEKGL